MTEENREILEEIGVIEEEFDGRMVLIVEPSNLREFTKYGDYLELEKTLEKFDDDQSGKSIDVEKVFKVWQELDTNEHPIVTIMNAMDLIVEEIFNEAKVHCNFDEPTVEVIDKEVFYSIVKSDETISQVVRNLSEIANSNWKLQCGWSGFYSVNLSDELEEYFEETHGKKVPKDVFALIKCIGKAVKFERFLKYLELDEKTRIHTVTEKSLQRLVKSEIPVDQIVNAFSDECYVFSKEADNMIEERLDGEGKFMVAMTDDEKLSIYLKLEIGGANE